VKAFIRSYWKTLLFFVAIGLVGGYFVGIYQLDSFPEEMQQEVYSQGITKPILGLVSAFQSAGYGLVLGAVGILLGKKTGLWKDETNIEKKPLCVTLLIAAIGGLALILPDLLFFGRYEPAIMTMYEAKPTASFIIAAVLYGGVIEEVMLRLFMMSLIAFLLFKLSKMKTDKPTTGILVAATLSPLFCSPPDTCRLRQSCSD